MARYPIQAIEQVMPIAKNEFNSVFIQLNVIFVSSIIGMEIPIYTNDFSGILFL